MGPNKKIMMFLKILFYFSHTFCVMLLVCGVEFIKYWDWRYDCLEFLKRMNYSHVTVYCVCVCVCVCERERERPCGDRHDGELL